jgi:DNA-binding NtrC family response regulator
MTDSERLIMVIDNSGDRARHLKELLDFMDAPSVRTATPGNWKSRVVGHRLVAVFLNECISEVEVATLIDNVGKLDPDVPIVLVQGESHA